MRAAEHGDVGVVTSGIDGDDDPNHFGQGRFDHKLRLDPKRYVKISGESYDDVVLVRKDIGSRRDDGPQPDQTLG